MIPLASKPASRPVAELVGQPVGQCYYYYYYYYCYYYYYYYYYYHYYYGSVRNPPRRGCRLWMAVACSCRVRVPARVAIRCAP